MVPHAAAALLAATLEWTDVRQLGVLGRGFSDGVLGSWADRLPAAAKEVVRAPVWSLSRDSAGMHVDFESNATDLVLNCTYVYSSFSMWHFPSSGVAGLDLYGWDTAGGGRWRWMATTDVNNQTQTVNVLRISPSTDEASGHRRYRLHLPLYNGPVELQIGHPPGTVRSVSTPASRPVVWYGTSIAQGGVASRPGMAFTNSIAMGINRTVLNFGFSGNCLMETSVAQYLVNVTPPPALFVIDCSWNMKASMIADRTVPLVSFVRSALGPDVPIVLAEGTMAGQQWLGAGQEQKWDALRAGYDKLSPTDPNLHYVSHSSLYNFSYDPQGIISPTVGGCHPSDLGHNAIADFYKSFLPGLLKGAAAGPELLRGRRQVGRVLVQADEPAAGVEEEGGRDAPNQDWEWVDVEKHIGVVGRAFNGTDGFFSRLPAAAKGAVPPAVWAQSRSSAGMAVPFVTASARIAVNYTLSSQTQLWDMPLSGASGADLFRYDATVASYRFVGCVQQFGSTDIVASLSVVELHGEARYLLFLPPWAHPERVAVGVVPGSAIVRDPEYGADGVTVGGRKPVVWYGGAAAQGAATRRPGSSSLNILTRSLGRAVLNFGFAGAGTLDTGVVAQIVSVDAAAFVIDCTADLTAAEIAAKTGPFVKYVRSKLPAAPIVLSAGIVHGNEWAVPGEGAAKRAAVSAAYEELKKDGAAAGVHLVANSKDELFGSDIYVSPTVGEDDPSDLGHREIANYFGALLSGLLGTE